MRREVTFLQYFGIFTLLLEVVEKKRGNPPSLFNGLEMIEIYFSSEENIHLSPLND